MTTGLKTLCLALGLAAALGPAAAAPLDDAVTHLQAGRPAQAEALLSRLIAAQPNEVRALYYRGRAREALGRLDEAAADYQAVLEVKPDSANTWVAVAELRGRQGKVDEAGRAWRKVLELEPGNAAAKAALAKLAAPAGQSAAPAAPARPVGPVGPKVAMAFEGLPDETVIKLTESGADVNAGQLLDYTFGSAPTDWVPTGGEWSVTSRFACDPTWSFFGGHSEGLACIWNKRQFTGDLVVEAYVAFKHGLPWVNQQWSYRPADLCISVCGDGRNPGSGYSFVYAGDEASRTMILRGDKVLAETSDPQFLTPSYSDTKPDTDEFHRRWWRLEARRDGRRLSFFIDGQKALEVEDPEPLAGGQVALWTVQNGMMIARARIAYEREDRPHLPLVRIAQPAPLPDSSTTVAAAR